MSSRLSGERPRLSREETGMWIVRAALRNPYAVAVIALLIVVLGLVAAWNIPVDILPVFKAPAVQVMTYYGGMPTPAVEKTITNRIERWVNQAAGVESVDSKSILGVSIVRLYFQESIDPNGALTQVNSLALGTLPTLPPNTLPPVVLNFDPTGTLPLAILSVTSPEMGETALKDVARINVRNMLGGVPGAVAPAVFGGKDRTILVYVDPAKLQTRDLSTLDVVNALQRENLMLTPGLALISRYAYQLDSNAMAEAVADMNGFPVRLERGNNVYVRDIGHAEDSHSIQTGLVRINGRRQVYVPVYRRQGSSSLAVVDNVNAAIPHMTETLRADGYDVKLDLVMDQSVFVREAIKSLVHEGVVGAALVSLVILIFLGNWRMTVIATLAIPLAILCGIIGLYATGNTINAMTLGGLALAIGPLVDNAIVVLENTHRHRTLGQSRLEAAYYGAVELTVPVLVATLTTVIVLCPIALMPGMGGFLFRPLTLAVAFAMFASFVLSWTLVPALCANWLTEHVEVGEEHEAPPGGFRRLHRPIERFLHGLTHRYEAALRFALGRRRIILTAVGLLFLGSLGFLFGIGQEFFPQVDAGQITIFVRCPSGTNLGESERRIAGMEAFLEENIPESERKMVISQLGLVPDWSAAYTPNSAMWDAVIRVQLTEERTRSAQEYAVALRHAMADHPDFADLRVSFDTGGMISAALNYGAAAPIDIQLLGGSPEEALTVAQEVRDRVADIPGSADVHIEQRGDAPELFIEVDRKKAADVGLSEAEVMDQVAIAMNSSVGIRHNFWIDKRSGNQYFVAVQYPEDPTLRLEDVLNIVATGPSQPRPVKLSSLVHVRRRSTPVEVHHVDLARVYDVLVNTEGRDIGSLADDVQDRLRDLELPSGMRIALKGEYSRMRQSFGSLGFGLILASVLVYLLLVALFRSWAGPFIIMFTVPLGLIGVLALLFFTRTTLNVQSSMGVIFLVGIVVSNGVLLVDFANKQRQQGARVEAAIATAAVTRLRPILMTFLATFFDLLPMAIGFGRGSEANVPLARAVVGGLVTSTALTLFVVPILYTLLIRGDLARHGELLDAALARRRGGNEP